MDLVDRLNAQVAETRAIGGVPWRPWDDTTWRFDIGGPVHPSRQGVAGVDGALRLQPVYSSVRILAEGVAMLPLQQFRDTGDRRQKMALGQLLSKPSAFINTFDWLFQYVSSAALQGTAPGLITGTDGYGMPTSVEWLPPEDFDAVDAKPFNPGKTRFYFAGREIPRDQLLLVRAFTIPGRTLGISPLRYHQMLIESGLDALAYGDGWYKAGGFPPGTFQNSQYEVDKTQADEIKKRLVGAMRRREPLVYGRDWEYKPISVPPSEAQFVEAMQLNATQIAAIYGVPPHRVGGTRGDPLTYSTVEGESLSLISDTLDPWLVRLETALTEVLPARQYAQFNRNARLRTTAETRWNVYKLMRDIGAKNINEIRELEDEEPLPKPKTEDDYDGADYTPLTIQVAAAHGLKQELGAGPEGQPPLVAPAAPPSGAPALPPMKPMPVPAVPANGNGKARNG